MGNYDEFWANMPEQTPAPPPPPPTADAGWGAPMAYAPAPVLDAPPAPPAWQAPPAAWQPAALDGGTALDWAPPATPAGWLPPAGYQGVGSPAKSSRGWSVRRPFVVGITLIVALFGGAGVWYKVQALRPLHTPTQLAGLPRLEGAEFSRITEQMKTDLRRDGANRAVGAIYGTDDVPVYLLGAISGHGYDSAQEVLDDVGHGIQKSGGKTSAAKLAGLPSDIACSEVSSPFPGSVCVWMNSRSAGVLVGYDRDAAETASDIPEARAAVEG